MSKIYVVKHGYDVDGGYGDAIYNEETVFVTSNKEEAEAWVEHWDHPFTYETPYDGLTCCSFHVEEMEVMDHIDIHTPPTAFESFRDVGGITYIEDPDSCEYTTLTDPEEIHQCLLDICEKEILHEEEQKRIFEKTEHDLLEEYYAKHGEYMTDFVAVFVCDIEKRLDEAGYDNFHNGNYWPDACDVMRKYLETKKETAQSV